MGSRSTVNQVMGDGIMALFGAPLAHEDHAVRACFAALRDPVGDPTRETWRRVPAEARLRESRSASASTWATSSCGRSGTISGWTTRRLVSRRTWPREWSRWRCQGTISDQAETLRLATRALCRAVAWPAAREGAGRARSGLRAYGRRPAGSLARGIHAGAHPLRRSGRGARPAPRRRWMAAAGQGQVVALIGEPGMGKSRLLWGFSIHATPRVGSS